jgi:hypothetical protein
MIRTWFIALLLFGIVACAPASLAAPEKPRVTVAFELVEPEFKPPFTNVNQFNASVARELEKELAHEFGYLNFGPDSTNFVLQVELRREGSGRLTASGFIGTRFVLRLIDNGQPRKAIDNWPFRSSERFRDPISPKFFGDEVIEKFCENLRSRKDAVVQLFSFIPLADAVYFDVAQQPSPRYYIPLGPQFRIGLETCFDFIGEPGTHYGGIIPDEVFQAVNTLPPEFSHGVYANEALTVVRAGAKGSALSSVGRNGAIKGSLYITQYRPAP